MLTANSDKKAIPVIFSNKTIKVELIEALFAIDCTKSTIPF